jgi:hypothetical protein
MLREGSFFMSKEDKWLLNKPYLWTVKESNEQ